MSLAIPICEYCADPIHLHRGDDLASCNAAPRGGARPLVDGPDLPALGAILDRLIADDALDFGIDAGVPYLTIDAEITATEFAVLAAAVAAHTPVADR